MPPITNTVTREEAKWARQQLGWSQKRLIERAADTGYELSLSKLKAFEAGYLRPAQKFLQDLREFLKAEGVDFRDFAPAITSTKGEDQEDHPEVGAQIARGRRSCFYLSSELSEDEADKWFDSIERNQERIRELCEIAVVYGSSKDSPDRDTQEHQHELLNLLATDSLMLRTLIGANPVEARPLGGKKARKISDLLADFFNRNLEHAAEDEAANKDSEEEDAA